MQKPVLFLKSHVDAFTRKDGSTVKSHETKVTAKAKPDGRTGGPIKKGERIKIKPEFQDAGDDKETWHAHSDEEKGGLHMVQSSSNLNIKPVSVVHSHMIDRYNAPSTMAKAHVDAFTRKDGVTVQAHDTSVTAAAPAFASHADARRKIAESGAAKTGSLVYHDDDIGLSSTSHTTATLDEAKAHSATHHAHLESMGFKKKSEEKTNSGSAEFTTSYYKHPSGALANVSHSNGMQKIKGKNIPGASMEVHSNVKNDEKKEWKSGAKPPEKPKNDPHPDVIGQAKNVKEHGFEFNGKEYSHTGKEGKSMHDGGDVRQAESDDGHRVWADKTNRVHADSREDAKKFRGD